MIETEAERQQTARQGTPTPMGNVGGVRWRCASLVAGVVALAVVVGVSAPVQPSGAAVPGAGRIDPRTRHIRWTGGPLVGTAPAFRRITCDVPGSCDDFSLDVDLPAKAFRGRLPVLRLRLQPSTPNAIALVVCPPGACTPLVPGTAVRDPTVSDYVVYPPPSMSVGGQRLPTLGGVASAAIRLPRAGRWTVRAGCIACAGATYTVDATVTTVPAPSPPRQRRFAEQVLPGLDKAHPVGAGEPGIDIGPQGEIWVNGPGPTAEFWSSYDHGRTFQLHEPVTDFSTGDTWLTIGPDGTVYAVNLVEEQGFGNDVYVSRDRGKTWTNATLPTGNRVPYLINVDSDRQWITADPKVPGTVYFESHDAAEELIWVYRSQDYGRTWLPLSSISLDDLTGRESLDTVLTNTTTPIVFAPNGTMHFTIAFTDLVQSATIAQLPTNSDFVVTKILVASSHDRGTTWEFHVAHDSHGSAYIDHGFTPLSFDRDSNLYLAWSERPVDGVITRMRLATSVDGGRTWSPAEAVGPQTGSNVFPAIAAKGDPGRVDVAWLTSPAPDFNDPNANWRVVMAQSVNALSAHPTFEVVPVSDDIVHAGDICQAGLFCTVTSGNRSLLDYIYMDVDRDGMAHIVYADDVGDLRTVHAAQLRGPSTLARPRPSRR